MELTDVVKRVEDHDGRIKVLEINDATTAVQIGGLTKVLWALVAGLFTALLTFFFWFIQTIGGRGA